MKIQKESIKGSPFIGIFACVTEKIGLFNYGFEQNEIKKLEEFFEIEIIQTSIANSSLIGCLVKGNSKGFITAETATQKELDAITEKIYDGWKNAK